MPFPLAHPAAVLPLRRWCPRFLSFPALVVGSLVPDLAYLSGPLQLDELSHQLWGSVVCDLPLGVLALGIIYGLRYLALNRLPRAWQPDLLRSAWPPLGSPMVVIGSLLLGIWSHLFLDSFTHPGGWLVERLPWLQISLGFVAEKNIRVCSILWYACSFAGVAFVFLALRNWQQKLSSTPAAESHTNGWTGALLLALAVLPIEVVHHLLRNWIGRLLVAFLTLLLLVVILRKMTTRKFSQ
jgi:hypothetical protein